MHHSAAETMTGPKHKQQRGERTRQTDNYCTRREERETKKGDKKRQEQKEKTESETQPVWTTSPRTIPNPKSEKNCMRIFFPIYFHLGFFRSGYIRLVGIDPRRLQKKCLQKRNHGFGKNHLGEHEHGLSAAMPIKAQAAKQAGGGCQPGFGFASRLPEFFFACQRGRGLL